MTGPALPIDAVLPEILSALADGTGLVLAAPPGAGKTTRVPLALLGADWLAGHRVLVLEPRRLAVRAAAERMAETLGEPAGRTVGYRMRGETKVSEATRVEVITEGILTRMLLAEPDLPGIGAILFDEVHERSIHTDLGLALALEARAALRPDLRLVAMSATLDTAAFARIMQAPVIETAGTAHPVETIRLERPWRRPGDRPDAFVRAAADLVAHALDETTGDVLVFLPGAREIGETARLLGPRAPEVLIAPLMGALPQEAQRAALRPAPEGRRRVVLATAIAETSLTVPGVRVVVDAGRARRSRLDPATGLARLVTEPVSRAEADQRRGRAGRLGPGTCYRMWTRGEEGALPAAAPPEILGTDLAPLALDLAAWGARGPEDLAFIDPPGAGAYAAARELLAGLGALDAEGRITDHGRAMAAHALHPRLAHMMILAGEEGLGAEAALLAALLSEGDPLRGGAAGADLALRTEALLGRDGIDPARRARIRDEARRLHPGRAARARLEAHAGWLLALAYPDRIAQARADAPGRYLLTNGRGAVLPADDPVARARYLVAADLADGKEARIRLAAALGEADLRRAAGPAVRTEERVEWSRRAGRVEARRRARLGAIALKDEPWTGAPPEALGRALAEGLAETGLAAIDWPKAALALRARVNWLRAQGGALAGRLPDLSDDGLVATLSDWLTPHLGGLTRPGDVARLDLTALLRGHLGWELARAVDRAAPSHFETPLGSRIAIDYTGAAPVAAVRLQELFGVKAHPVIGDPPVALVLSLLSPAGRPVQTTADLPAFWQGSYSDVRKEMRARYPKHPWPEDPARAAPTRRTKAAQRKS